MPFAFLPASVTTSCCVQRLSSRSDGPCCSPRSRPRRVFRRATPRRGQALRPDVAPGGRGIEKDRGGNHPARGHAGASQPDRLHRARPAGHRLRDHAVQLAAERGRAQDCTGTCRRQRRCPQAFRADAIDGGRARQDSAGRRAAAASHFDPAWNGRYGRSRLARRCADRVLQLHGQYAGRTRDPEGGRPSSDATRTRAASRARSCAPTPISTLRSPKLVAASFRKAGQVCTSVQRIFVHRSLAEASRGASWSARGSSRWATLRSTRPRSGP